MDKTGTHVITAQPRRMGLILGWFKALRELRGRVPSLDLGAKKDFPEEMKP